MARAHTHPKYKALYETACRQLAIAQQQTIEVRKDLEGRLALAKEHEQQALEHVKGWQERMKLLQQEISKAISYLAVVANEEVIPAMRANAYYKNGFHEVPERVWTLLWCWYQQADTREQSVGRLTSGKMTWQGAPVVRKGELAPGQTPHNRPMGDAIQLF